MLPKNIPHTLGCPHCQSGSNQEANLHWRFHPHPNGDKSEYLSYYCDKCKHSFTTTESDTISMSRYRSKKRSLLRKDKINRKYDLS